MQITAADFMVAIVATLARRGWATLDPTGGRIDRGAQAAFAILPAESIEPRFFIRLRGGRSATVGDAVGQLVAWRCLTIDAPYFDVIRIAMTPSFADRLLALTRIEDAVAARLADAFVEGYEGPIDQGA